MKHLDGILDMVDKELGSIAQGGQFRSRDDVHSVYELIDIAKDVYCIWKYEDGEEGYSEERGGNYENYYGGNSYARGRGRGAARYADGRYAPTSRDSYDGNNYRRGSYRGSYDGGNYYDGGGSMRSGNYRRGGYSRDDAKKEYAENLRKMMEEAPDEQTKQSIQRMVENLERE